MLFVNFTNTLELIQKASKSPPHKEFDLVHRILSRSALLKDEIVVVKISAFILNDDDILQRFLSNIALLHSSGARLLIVHDASDALEHAMDFFGVAKSKFHDIQMSDHKSANILEMVLSGHINKKIVSILCKAGCNAIGISGKDCDIIQAEQRVKKVQNNNIVNLGFTADPTMINAEALLTLLESDTAIVLSPIASCSNGTTCILDTNITSALLASALAAKYLILPCSDPNIDDGGMVITDYDRHQLKQMRSDPRSSSDFKLILDTANSALDNYVDYICIADETKPDSIIQSIFCTEKDEF